MKPEEAPAVPEPAPEAPVEPVKETYVYCHSNLHSLISLSETAAAEAPVAEPASEPATEPAPVEAPKVYLTNESEYIILNFLSAG